MATHETPEHSIPPRGQPMNAVDCSSSSGFCSNGRRRARTPMSAQTTTTRLPVRNTARPTATAVLYARVSSKDQADGGFSIPAQQKLLREYASAHGLAIVREFVDVETAK